MQNLLNKCDYFYTKKEDRETYNIELYVIQLHRECSDITKERDKSTIQSKRGSNYSIGRINFLKEPYSLRLTCKMKECIWLTHSNYELNLIRCSNTPNYALPILHLPWLHIPKTVFTVTSRAPSSPFRARNSKSTAAAVSSFSTELARTIVLYKIVWRSFDETKDYLDIGLNTLFFFLLTNLNMSI